MKSESSVEVWSPGKVILAGEHFVVHGGVALALAIDRYTKVRITSSDRGLIHVVFSKSAEESVYDGDVWRGDLPEEATRPILHAVQGIFEWCGVTEDIRLEIEYGFPRSAGLGSSASLAAAIVKGLASYLGSKLTRQELLDLASRYEAVVHGNPSGIDLNTVVSGGLVLFDGGTRSVSKRHEDLDLKLLVFDTGERRSTGDLVRKVTSVRTLFPDVFSALVDISDRLVRTSWDAVTRGQEETLGTMFQISQGLLHSVGVSTKLLDECVHAALDAGAIGAKLTGAGGGGCIIVVPGERRRFVKDALKGIGSRVLDVGADISGVSLKEV